MCEISRGLRRNYIEKKVVESISTIGMSYLLLTLLSLLGKLFGIIQNIWTISAISWDYKKKNKVISYMKQNIKAEPYRKLIKFGNEHMYCIK